MEHLFTDVINRTYLNGYLQLSKQENVLLRNFQISSPPPPREGWENWPMGFERLSWDELWLQHVTPYEDLLSPYNKKEAYFIKKIKKNAEVSLRY